MCLFGGRKKNKTKTKINKRTKTLSRSHGTFLGFAVLWFLVCSLGEVFGFDVHWGCFRGKASFVSLLWCRELNLAPGQQQVCWAQLKQLGTACAPQCCSKSWLLGELCEAGAAPPHLQAVCQPNAPFRTPSLARGSFMLGREDTGFYEILI